MNIATGALDRMAAIVGPKGLSTDPDRMAPWLTDWRGRYHGAAAALVEPATTGEVSQIVRTAAAHKIPIVPQGGNSGMVGGATPDASGTAILLSLRRMNRIREVNAAAKLAVCDAGVILQNLHEELVKSGLRFPLTLGGKGSATIGGLVSTNAGGTQVLRHGTMRALVAGLEAVLPDGSIYHGLTALKKDNRGYDLKQLLIGGEGTIGIVTGVTVKTVPALIDRCVIWAGLDSPEQAYDLLQFLSGRAGANLEGFEILPESCAASVMTHIPDVRRPLEGRFAWYALAELVRDSADGPDVQALAERLMSDAMELGLARDAAISANEAQAENCWKIRDSIAEAERASGPALQHDISVPVEKMAAFITSASPEVEARFPGTAVAAFGHLGDGNVHFHVKAPPGETKTWMDAQAGSISALVYDLVTREGGSISAEHGIGQNKLAELARLSDPAHLLALRAIKTAFDPDNLFNPGKLVPLA